MPLANTHPQFGNGRIVSEKITFEMPSTMKNCRLAVVQVGGGEDRGADDLRALVDRHVRLVAEVALAVLLRPAGLGVALAEMVGGLTPEAPTASKSTYGQILKSTALIGGSSVATIAIGVVRTKAMAVLLGPAGFGLMGLYGSIIDFVCSVASVGIGSSGVRQIAEAVALGDADRIARTAIVLLRTAVVLGLLGAAVTAVFAKPLSVVTFGSEDHAIAIALLSLAVFFRTVAAGPAALIQGMRRIADLAKLG